MPEGVLRRRAGAATAGVLLLAVLTRAWAAWADQGLFWPDEIYQSLEPAHLLAFGYGIVPWEFAEGARSWLFPGFLAAILQLLAWCGAGAPGLVIGAKLAMAALSVLGVLGAMRLAEAHANVQAGKNDAGRGAGLLAGLLCVAFPLLLVLGSRAMSEVASATLVVWTAVLIGRPTRAALALAGVLAGLAVFLRFQNGLLAAGFVVLLLAQRRFDALRAYLLALLATGLAGGLLDALTWGSPFASLRAYLQYNLVEGQSAGYGVQGAGFYFDALWTSTGPVALALLLGLGAVARRAAGLLAVAAVFVLAHVAIGHKELRFLLPVVPLLLALSAAGLAGLLERLPRAQVAAPAFAVVLAALLARHAQGLDFAALGQYRGQPAAEASPWHFNEGANRLLWAAGQRPDLCGLWVGARIRPPWIGGFTYLHRDVPLLWGDEPASAAFANYALLPPADLPAPVSMSEREVPLPAAYQPLMRAGGWVLLQRPGACGSLPPDTNRRFY